MSRFEIRVSELVEKGYKLDQAKELAHAEESERLTDAVNRLADYLYEQVQLNKRVQFDRHLIR